MNEAGRQLSFPLFQRAQESTCALELLENGSFRFEVLNTAKAHGRTLLLLRLELTRGHLLLLQIASCLIQLHDHHCRVICPPQREGIALRVLPQSIKRPLHHLRATVGLPPSAAGVHHSTEEPASERFGCQLAHLLHAGLLLSHRMTPLVPHEPSSIYIVILSSPARHDPDRALILLSVLLAFSCYLMHSLIELRELLFIAPGLPLGEFLDMSELILELLLASGVLLSPLGVAHVLPLLKRPKREEIHHFRQVLPHQRFLLPSLLRQMSPVIEPLGDLARA